MDCLWSLPLHSCWASPVPSLSSLSCLHKIKATLDVENSGVKLKHWLASHLKAMEQEVKLYQTLISPLMGRFWHWAVLNQSPPYFPWKGTESSPWLYIWHLSLKINPWLSWKLGCFFVPFDSRVLLTLSNLFSISLNMIDSFLLMLLDPEEAEQTREGKWGDRYFKFTQR